MIIIPTTCMMNQNLQIYWGKLMVDVAVLRQRLCEAEDAYHSLMTGCRVVEVFDQNGEKVRYDKVNLQDLRNYIDELKRQLGQKVCGPMGFIY